MTMHLHSGGALAATLRSTRRAAVLAALTATPLLGAAHAPAFAAPETSTPILAPASATSKQERFFQAHGAAAVASMRETGVPASVTLAQAALESAWGESRLSRQVNNYFGIKAPGGSASSGVVWMKTWEVVKGQNVTVSQPFRAYRSAAESFTDHGWFFVRNSRYARALAAKIAPKAFAREIARAGYATDPNYAQKLIQMMDRYNLYRFDAEAKLRSAP